MIDVLLAAKPEAEHSGFKTDQKGIRPMTKKVEAMEPTAAAG